MHALMCVPGIWFHSALIQVHLWKRPCYRALRGRPQWQPMVTFCHLLGRLELPPAGQAPTRKRADQQAPSEDIMVQPDGSRALHGGNHDFFTFQRGMECAVCEQSMRIWCNTCVFCHTCFVKDARPCVEATVQVVDDAAEVAQNNSEEGAVAPRKCDSKRALARAQAKLVCAANASTLRDWTRTRICDCFGGGGG